MYILRKGKTETLMLFINEYRTFTYINLMMAGISAPYLRLQSNSYKVSNNYCGKFAILS